MSAQTAVIADHPHDDLLSVEDGVATVSPHTAHRWVRSGEALLVDVREAGEIENEHIPGALMMPLSFFDAEHFPRVPGMKVVLLCAVGKRSAAAAKQLRQAGHPLPINMAGGLNAWRDAGLPTEA